VGVRWPVTAIVGLLIVLAAVLFWMLYPRRVPEEAYLPPPGPKPSETVTPGLAPAGESDTKVAEFPAAAPPVQPLPERVRPEPPPKEREGLAEKESTAPAKVGQTKSSRRTRPPAPPQDVAPGAKRGVPDGSDIIDWLLKQR
jgi:hypothetical protein